MYQLPTHQIQKYRKFCPSGYTFEDRQWDSGLADPWSPNPPPVGVKHDTMPNMLLEPISRMNEINRH